MLNIFLTLKIYYTEQGAENIRIFGGGGGVITPKEIELLEGRGITKIYSPADGMKLGLDGIIDDIVEKISTLHNGRLWIGPSSKRDDLNSLELSKVISFIENNEKAPININEKKLLFLGLQVLEGAGKSSLIDELLLSDLIERRMEAE